jgi:hypothetical protein
MIYPYAGIDQDHRFAFVVGAAAAARRRGAAPASGSLPPIAASRARASLATRERSPSRTRSLIRSSPEASRAFSTRSSSRISVVLIHTNMYTYYASVKAICRPTRQLLVGGDRRTRSKKRGLGEPQAFQLNSKPSQKRPYRISAPLHSLRHLPPRGLPRLGRQRGRRPRYIQDRQRPDRAGRDAQEDPQLRLPHPRVRGQYLEPLRGQSHDELPSGSSRRSPAQAGSEVGALDPELSFFAPRSSR